MMKSLLMAAATAAFLFGCSSNVPLTEVPVSDASATIVAPADAQGAASGVTNGAVTPVILPSDAQPMAGPKEARVIYFDFDSYVVKPEFQSVIVAHARYLMDKSASKIAIEGHTDEVGGREYNLALGQKRADAVRSALALLGVPQNRIESVSFGKEKPAVAGADEAAYAKNRRAEIRYL